MKLVQLESTEISFHPQIGALAWFEKLPGPVFAALATYAFRQAVVEMLRQKPQRLIIEPTGVAAVKSVREVFADAGITAFSCHFESGYWP